MINLSGYQIKQEIYKSSNSTVFRGTRDSDNSSVIVKLLNKDYPTKKELSAFTHEYELMDKITGDGIIKAYELRKYNNSLAIIMEDIGGESVIKVLQTAKPDILERLSLAIRMTESLLQIHKQNVIHKDINPANYIWNTETNTVKITDFGISTELAKESPRYVNVNDLEGTLDYISPEQTGRINRQIDYRTDLYSLGITLYELFTGRKPFKGSDESEIVYCHLAKAPIPPSKINPEIPNILSDIIMKLISKTAEDRYQSASGLKKDLEKYLQMIQQKKVIGGFKLGEGDIFGRFDISHKLYGREKETEELVESFENAANGSCEFILVNGYSGIGKSSLINEIRKPIAGKKGRFISGKFSESEKSIPYCGVIRAFQELMKQLLAEPQPDLDNWSQRLTGILGSNAQVIVDIIPELERVIGPQPQAIALDPLGAQNRFHMVFRDFVKVFAKQEHPLVVFLDDLQWSDVSTLDLLKYILTIGKLQHVLFIGAYRDNEVQAGHPLMQMLGELKKDSIPFRQLFLKPLGLSSINHLIADTLHCTPDTTHPLAELILQKTKGNPFFINRLLDTLYHQESFMYIADKGLWEYDFQKIQSADISDNVVDLLIRSLKSLPAETIEILKLAACTGNQFDLTVISQISNKSMAVLDKCLLPAIENEIVYPTDYNYRIIKNLISFSSDFEIRFCFAHDRIRQAVYSLLSKGEETKFHLMIGRKYLETLEKREDLLFDIANHLNIGIGLIKDTKDRIELSDLNIIAGKKAKHSAAFAVASGYFETAESLLTKEEWSQSPDKLFDLRVERAAAALLSGDLEKAIMLCDLLSNDAGNNIDNGTVTNIRVQILEFQGKLCEAIEEIRRSLRLFDVLLPEDTQEIGLKIQEGITKMQVFLAQTPVEQLPNLPEMKDPEKLMVMQLLFQVVPPSLQINPQLYILASLMMFELTCTYGTSPFACKCFTDCGIVLESTFGDYKTSYKLGEAAFSLINKFKAEALKPAVYFGFTFSSYWRAHYKESLDYYDMAYSKGLETGDIQHAAYALSHKIHLLMWIGKNLSECNTETKNAIAILKGLKTAMPLLLTQIIQYLIDKFQSTPEKYDDSEIEKNDNEMLSKLAEIKDLPFLGRFYQYNTYFNIISGNMEAADKWNAMAERIIFAGLADYPIPDHYMFQALIHISKWKEAEIEEKAKIKASLNNIKQKLKNWAENCPENFAHKYYLISAEMSVIENESLDITVDLFKKVFNSIGSGDFINIRALCNELYGRFWLEKGDETIGKAYIREAYYLYQQWGAYRKAAQLEKQYSNYFTIDKKRGISTNSSSSTTQNSIDMISILRSTQAISSEIKTEKLLTTFIQTIIENAGAQKGLLLLKDESDNQLYIEAKQDIDSEQAYIMQTQFFRDSSDLCPEIVQYVARTKETVVIHDACKEGNWQNNAYIVKNRVKSVLCIPVIYQTRFKGVIYLENNLTDNVFTSERLEILNILSSQAAISIENARLYQNMEENVRERTAQLDQANKKLKELSFHDSLTDLYNRRYTFEYVSDKINSFIQKKFWRMKNEDKRETAVEDKVIGILLLDIDHFKEVNDTYGHSAGDIALISISKVLKQMIRSDDYLVRWGGEEFLIILYNTKPDFLKKFSYRVIETVKETPIKIADNEVIHKTCSLGYTEMPLDSVNPGLLNLEQMINLSDYALYRAKEAGRNCAAHLVINKLSVTKDDFIKCMTNLSKTTKVNEEYFKIEFVKTIEE